MSVRRHYPGRALPGAGIIRDIFPHWLSLLPLQAHTRKDYADALDEGRQFEGFHDEILSAGLDAIMDSFEGAAGAKNHRVWNMYRGFFQTGEDFKG